MIVLNAQGDLVYEAMVDEGVLKSPILPGFLTDFSPDAKSSRLSGLHPQ